MWSPPVHHPLRRLFAGLTEHAFMSSLGVADPPLVDYVSGILARFLHNDVLYRLRDGEGNPIHEVVDMIREAEQLPAEGRTRREYHRHIGDFTLYWTGLYPEWIQRARSGWSKDHFISYCETGKRSYRIASQSDDVEESAVLRRLSDEFELCALGLNHVRKEFESLHVEGEGKVIG
ncbi:MAG: hypothetical protein K8T89_07850 [Planctomycetes bacterium]|nr:hypothetical protein [Planctomycetota bacterium]